MTRKLVGLFGRNETVLVKAITERTVVIDTRHWSRSYLCQKSPGQVSIWYAEDELMKTTQPPKEEDGSPSI